MCWKCDSLAPACGWVGAPDRDLYFMCGLCDPNLEESPLSVDEELLEELSGKLRTAEAGTQCGLGLVATEAARSRAEPRKADM